MSVPKTSHPKRQLLDIVDSNDSCCSSVIESEVEIEYEVDEHLQSMTEIPAKKRKLAVCKKEEDKVPLPDPFHLPKHFGTDVEVALATQKITQSARKSFISKVASSMLFYKRYPTSADYENVARTIISKYPFMRSPHRTPHVRFSLPCTVVYLSSMFGYYIGCNYGIIAKLFQRISPR